MARVLVLLATGPEYEARALEGLAEARAMHEIGMLDEVRLLLTGPGVRCLDRDDPACEPLQEALEGLVEAGVPTAACTRSLADHRLLDAAQGWPRVRPVGAPAYLSEHAREGWTVVSF